MHSYERLLVLSVSGRFSMHVIQCCRHRPNRFISVLPILITLAISNAPSLGKIIKRDFIVCCQIYLIYMS